MVSTFTALPVPKLSPTSVGELSCSRRFHTLRVLKQWPPRPPLSFGAFGLALHDILARVYDPCHQSRPRLDNLETWARQAFLKHRYADPAQRDEDMARCLRMVRGYVEQDDPECAQGTVAVEQFIEVPIMWEGRVICQISGRMDRIVAREDEPGRVCGRDYKTCAPRLDLDQACLQLFLVKTAYPDFASYAMQTDYIDEGGRVDRITVDGSELRGVFPGIMRRMLDVVTSDTHPEQAGEHCTFCPLRPTCAAHVGLGHTLDLAHDIFATA